MDNADRQLSPLPEGTTSPPPLPQQLGLEEIACDGCKRSFMAMDGPGMIAAIQGPCPDCGGRFRLVK